MKLNIFLINAILNKVIYYKKNNENNINNIKNSLYISYYFRIRYNSILKIPIININYNKK